MDSLGGFKDAARSSVMKLPRGCVLVSDLHAEAQSRRAKRTLHKLHDAADASILLLAGDVGNFQDGSLTDALRHAADVFDTVCYVPGNHDYYGFKADIAAHPCDVLHEANSTLADMCAGIGITFLQKTVVNVRRAVVAGATLWSPATHASRMACEYMTDYYRISGFTPAMCHAIHDDHSSFLESMCTDPDISPDVVVTHHAPLDLPRMRHREYTPESAALFHGNLAPLFDNPAFSVKLWCFGHTHIRRGTRATNLRRTKLVANALGFDHDRLFSLPDPVVRAVD